MSIVEAILLGITQGATEFAPVSSSGHLVVVPWLFGWSSAADPELAKAFDVALHVGSFLGALVYFRADLTRYGRALGRSIGSRAITSLDERLAWALVVGTIPAAVVGATLEGTIEQRLGAPWLIAVMLAVGGVVLWAIDRWARRDRPLNSIRPSTGLYLGIAQALALQPGVSRSGITISAARAIGLGRDAAARFSFLLAMPVVLGAGIYKGLELARTGLQGYAWAFFWGFVASAVSGFLVISFALRYLRTHSFAFFMWYRLVLAGVILFVFAAGTPEGAT